MEAICRFLCIIGKKVDECPKLRQINDDYFNRMEDLSVNKQLSPRTRYLVRDVIDLRSNNWVSTRVGFLLTRHLVHMCEVF